MGSENRKRANKVTIRLDDDELQRIEKKAQTVGKTVPALLRDLALKQRVKSPIIDFDGAIEIGKQIRAVGNNLNQLTRLSNKGELEVVDLDETKRELFRVWQLLNSVQQAAQTGSSATVKEKQPNETE